MISRLVLAAVAQAGVTFSEASAQQSLQELESANQFQQAMAAVDAIKHRKEMQCVLSAIDGAVCQCLSQNLPVDTYVRSYAALAKREGEYTQLSVPTKTIIDRCVGDNR
jgi:hypothetical protein